MQIHKFSEMSKGKLGPLAVAIGNFDGIHLGHRIIIKQCKELTASLKVESAVVTFEPHTALVLGKGASLKLLSTYEEKLQLIEQTGIDHLIIMKFDESLIKLTPKEFVKKILVEQLQAHGIVTGYDFHFGESRKGNAALLESLSQLFGYRYIKVNPVEYQGYTPSSSLIRDMLSKGLVGTAQKLLGRKYKISGVISKGQGIGKQLDARTANIKLKEGLQYPLNGVYLVEVKFLSDDEKHYGIANIGVKPTFSQNRPLPLLEVHILDFNKEIYGIQAEVSFLHFIRPERKFKNQEQLKVQIKRDTVHVKYVIANIESLLSNSTLFCTT